MRKPIGYYKDQHGIHPYFLSWQKIGDPSTGWLASKTVGWTADQFTPGGLEVDFSAVVPAGTKAVRVVVHTAATLSDCCWRKAGDTNISNTPKASQEYSHVLIDQGIQWTSAVIWLSPTYKAQFTVDNILTQLYIAYPTECLS